MPVALALLVGLVADPFVDQSLIDALAGTGADETMAQDVEATDHFPRGIGQCPLEMVMYLIFGETRRGRHGRSQFHRRASIDQASRAGPLASMSGSRTPFFAMGQDAGGDK